MHMLFLFKDQIYKIPFLYTKQPSHIPEAWKRYFFSGGSPRESPRGGRCGPKQQLFYVENTLTQSLMVSSKAGCSKSISSIMFAIE